MTSLAEEATTPRIDPPEDIDAAIAAAIASPAWAEIVEMRVQQIAVHGHTPGKDDDEPPLALGRRARGRLDRAIESLSLGGWDLLGDARRNLVKAAAMQVALIDMIDRKLASRERRNN